MKTGGETVHPANYGKRNLVTCRLARQMSWEDLFCCRLHN